MPILWRYLLGSYFQVLALCTGSFVSVLLVLRFREIATFASAGAPLGKVLLFTLYFIPYILPLALPISALIAAILLFMRLSQTHELTALRAAGLGLRPIAYPLILSGAALSLLNFAIVSEVAPRCKCLSKELIYEIAAINPLALFQKEKIIKLKDAHVDMKSLKNGRYAKEVLVILKDLSNERLGIMTADELSLDGKELHGKGISLITTVAGKGEFDHLVIENQEKMSTGASHLSDFLHTANWQTHDEYLPLRMVLAKASLQKATQTKKRISGAELEVVRRISISLAPFTFTLIGTAFGMQVGRRRSKKGVFWAISLASLFFICFLGAKSFRHQTLPSLLFYLAPHPLIMLVILASLKRLKRGVEG